MNMQYVREMYKKLADQQVRIFMLRLRDCNREKQLWVAAKTVEEWRQDIRKFRDSSERTCEEGWANDKVWNDLYKYLHDLGYIEVDDIVADVFEGRIAQNSSSLVDDPDHDDIQAEGFGHFGWEKDGWLKKEEK